MGAQGSETEGNVSQAVSLPSSSVDLWARSDEISKRLGSTADPGVPGRTSADAADQAAAQATAAILGPVPGDTREHDDGQGRAAERPEGPPAAALPCQDCNNCITEEERPPLPGPRKKQAQALLDNLIWLVLTFGIERIGFLTLTLGDLDAGGRFRNLRDRKEAERRFHSLLTNIIAKRYLCGVVIVERHANGGLHFHLVVVCAEDIRGTIDFDACFPPKDHRGKPVRRPDYRTANPALKREWAYWRRIAKCYGFGRHELQPVRESAEALGHYLGDYLTKDWANRLPEDKGARCIRYFGHWSKKPREGEQRKATPPFSARFGWMTPQARTWREMVSQVAIVLRSKGAQITESNIKDVLGRRWAWKVRKLSDSVRFEIGDWQNAEVQAGIAQHNLEVKERWLADGYDPSFDCWWHITEVTLDNFRPSPEWIKQGEELKLAKECEAVIRRGIKQLAREKARREEDRRSFAEATAGADYWI